MKRNSIKQSTLSSRKQLKSKEKVSDNRKRNGLIALEIFFLFIAFLVAYFFNEFDKNIFHSIGVFFLTFLFENLQFF